LVTKILVVDDNYELANLITEHLINAEYKCDIALTYESALRYLNKRYDVVITDILLKDANKTGLDFAVQYKLQYPKTFIIAISGNENLQTNYGIDYFIPKPINFPKMISIIESRINLSIIDLIETVDCISKDIQLIKLKLNI